MSKKPQIHESWLNILYGTFQQPFMQSLRSFLVEEMKSKTIYPRGNQIFAAFNHTPFESVRVVILGQDPYHGPDKRTVSLFCSRRNTNTSFVTKHLY